jgi:hypothetical protein
MLSYTVIQGDSKLLSGVSVAYNFQTLCPTKGVYVEVIQHFTILILVSNKTF